jgi:alpha-tubulin suppressor-like RCC1 family protein
LAIDNNGLIYSWGNGQGGRLGHNQEVGENAPRQIKDLASKHVKYIEAGDASSACITHDLMVYMWGSGLNGRLGNGTNSFQLQPQLSQELKDKQVCSIFKGTNSTFAILETGHVFGWGSSKNGKLGFALSKGKNYDLPREIITLDGNMLYQIAAGPFHTILLTTEGNLLSMGNSKDGKLGYDLQGSTVVDVVEPQRIRTIPKGTQFFCNTQVATIIKQYPLFDDYDEFSKLRSLYAKDDPYEINQIVCGDNFQLFLTNNGQLYSTGSNNFGQLGLEHDVDGEEEVTKGDKGEAGNENAYIPKNLRSKIRNLEKRKERLEPEQVTIPVPTGTSKVKFCAVGAMHAMVIMNNDNGVYAWGKNTYG